MALAAMTFQAADVYSATTVEILAIQYSNSAVPGSYVHLTSSGGIFPSTFPSGQYYAGVLQGTADYDGVEVGDPSIATSFFCAELNKSITLGTYSYTSSSLMAAGFNNGVGGGLTTEQKCMLIGVYDFLLTPTFTVNGFVNTGNTQDISGTTNTADATELMGLSNARAAAAQLVMWEIIHEPVSPIYSGKAPIIGLATGNLNWSADAEARASWNDIESQFNLIAPAAYQHAATYCGLVAVPEVTSPVALIAGGLLFVRRREPRALRLTKAAG